MADNKQFDEVLLILIKQEEKKLREGFAELGGITPQDANSLDNDFEDRLFSVYQRGDSQKLTYASSLGMRISLNLCIANNLKDAIDGYHTADPSNDLNQSTRDRMKKYVDEKLAVECRTPGEKKLYKNISEQFKNHINSQGTTQQFLYESYIAFENTYSLKNDKEKLANELAATRLRANIEPNVHNALYRANMSYVDELKDTAIAPVEYQKTYYDAPDVGIDDVRYGKKAEDLEAEDLVEVVVEPKSFIESFKKQKAYEARDTFPDIKKMVKKSFEEDKELNLADKNRQLRDLRKNETMSEKEKEIRIGELEQDIKDISKEKFSDWDKDRIMDYFDRNSSFLKEENLPGYHKLSDNEMDYCNSVYNSIVKAFNDNISEFSGNERETTEWKIKIDGQTCERKEEIVAAALSGKKITGEYAFEGEPERTVDIQPEFFAPKREDANEYEDGGKWANPNASAFDKLIELFESLWESFLDAIGFSEKAQKEKREKALEEKVEKGNKKLWKNKTRTKTSYSEIAVDSFSDKLISDERRIELEGSLDKSKYKPAPNAAAAAPNAATVEQDNVVRQNDTGKKDAAIEKITIADISNEVKKTTSANKSGTVEKKPVVQKNAPEKNK